MQRTAYDIDEQAAFALGAVRQGRELRMACPVHDSSPETLALRRGKATALWHCHAGCATDEVRDALLAMGVLQRLETGTYRPPQTAEPAPGLPSWILPVWNAAMPIGGTPAAEYLLRRNLKPPWPPALRWDRQRRRMLAAVVRDDRLAGLHVTRLPAKERTHHGTVRGGVIRLARAPRNGVLALAEGVETALAYMALSGHPTWSALSSAGLAAVVLPAGVQRLVIAADFDGSGLVAAESLEKRARDEGVPEVHIDVPSRYRSDWADVLMVRR